MAMFEFCRKGGYKVFQKAMAPAPDWGPAKKCDREGTVYALRDRQEAVRQQLANSGVRDRKISTMSTADNPAFTPETERMQNGYLASYSVERKHNSPRTE